MQNRFTIGTATVLMLVLLRLNIGWHFYSEGTKHLTDPAWSSEGFLRAAKGPLAPLFQSVLPDYYGLREIAHSDLTGAASTQTWSSEVTDAWQVYFEDFRDFYNLSEKQAAEGQAIVHRRQSQFQSWLADKRDAIVDYVHERERLAKQKTETSAGDVPYQKKRIADKQTSLNAEAKGWLSEVKGIEQKLCHDLEALLTPEQSQAGTVSPNPSKLKTVDTVMTYGILGIGICLVLGLFTRLACVLGAAFLLSVVLTQPFWVSETQPTFNQFVEMFALLALATTHVGRWGGLDFFIHYLLVRPFQRGERQE